MTDQALEAGTPIPDLDIMEIMRLIPHRFPMLMIDRLVELTAYRRAVGIKNVSSNEPFFTGHFPNDPIMPGVLIVEAMAQSAATLAVASLGPSALGSGVYFMGIDSARFRRPVRPGDQLRLEVVAQRIRLGVWKFTGRATVAGNLASEAEFAAKLMAP